MPEVTVPFYFPVTVDGWTISEIEGNATFRVHDFGGEYEAHLRTLEVDAVKVVEGKRFARTIELDESFPLYTEMWCYVDEHSGADAIDKYLTGDFYSGPTRAEIIRDDARVAAE